MGQRHYEQKDHLGNVVATISDRRIAVDQYNYTTGTTHVASTVINTVDPTRLAYMYVGTGGTKAFALGTDDMADGWMPEVESYSDYYPFGALMPGRVTNAGTYRYGQGGKEDDSEIKGTGNSMDYGARMYDTRLGRWMSCDPLASKYPELNPYNFCADNPIFLVDRDGKKILIHYSDENGNDQTYEYTGQNTYLGDNQYVKDVIASFEHAGKLGGKKSIMQVVESDKVLHIVEQSLLGIDGRIQSPMYSRYTSEGVKQHTIYWNSEGAGVENDEYGRPTGVQMSPARILYHELNHARHAMTNIVAFIFRRHFTKDRMFHNKEEKKTTKEENKVYGKKNGGKDRTTHFGSGEIGKPPVFETPNVDIPIQNKQENNAGSTSEKENVG